MLPVADQQVTRCVLDYAEVGILLANGIKINIGQAFVYVYSDGTQVGLDPEREGILLALVLRLMRMAVKSGIAFKDGRLQVNFEDGSYIEVPNSQQFEAWNITGPGGLLIVSIRAVIWRFGGITADCMFECYGSCRSYRCTSSA